MDLKKFKLISAVLLAVTLLILSVISMINKNQADNMHYSVAEDLSQLFAGRGVELSPDAIPLKRESLSVYSCPMADGTQAQRIAEAVGESTRLAANLTEDGYLFRLKSGAMIEISDLWQISFNTDGLNGELAFASPASDAARVTADAFIERFAPSLDEDEVFCTYTLTGYAHGQNGTVLNFDISIGGVQIEGNSLTVCQSGDGSVLSAYGKCVFSPLKKEGGYKHYDIINVLKKEYDSISEAGAPSGKLDSIEVCYLMRPSADNERILFLPGWRILYSDGTARYYESVQTDAH